MRMPRTPEEEPTSFSRAVAQGIADAIEEAGMSQAAVARKAGLSTNYFNERMRLVKSFTLSDIDKIARALRFNPARFLLDVDPQNVGPADDASDTDELPILTRADMEQRRWDLAADARPDRAVDVPAADEDQEADAPDDDEDPGR
jgi:transcriptional regulator with XRE-family HTH domain